ncbi:MAG TPA: polymer-forming cytoskeletal protein [Bryobacteraceae bacterium]|jgi:cytoskeletal protein CcmA (bactofilin family)
MWGKTSEPGFKSVTTEPPAANPLPERTQTPAAPSRAASSIGKTIRLQGEIYSEEELYLDGEVDGSVEVRHVLTIGPNGKVKANVKAKELVVRGSIQGDVEASDRISIMKGASIVGDVRTAGIVIEDGAYFKGGIDILRPEAPKKPEPAVLLASSAARAGAQ